MPYRQTQIARLIILAVVVSLIIIVVAYTLEPVPTLAAALTFGGLVLALLLFGSLTVEVAGGELRLRYGLGLIRKRWPLSEIERVQAVRLPWYYGWGIRFTPRGWLYRVSGLGAVEVGLRGGKTFFVGSDEPEALARALKGRLGA